MTLTLRSYAKINLSLDVLGLRADGYHDVETVMQKVSLCDEVTMSWESVGGKGEGPEIRLRTNKPYLPTDERNLAYKAALLMADFAGKPNGVLDIDIKKRIPVAAGLAGGSGNAAAVLAGLNRLWEAGLNTKELCELSAKLGSDVPFCVLTTNSRYTCALGTDLGDKLKPLKYGLKKHLVMAKPSFGVSTREVYREIDKVEIPKRPDTQALIDGLRSGDFEKLYPNMVNVLENYTLKAYPEVEELKGIIGNTADCEHVMMSGSGPTVLGFYASLDAAKNACMALREMNYEAYWASIQ